MPNDDPGPMDYIHQAVVHQLRHAADDIEERHGIVGDFDYEEHLDQDRISPHGAVTSQERIVTLEVSYILPK